MTAARGLAAAALALLAADARGQPSLAPGAAVTVEADDAGGRRKFLLVRDATVPGRCHYLSATFRVAAADSTEGPVPAVELVRYDNRKPGAEGESRAGAVLRFTATWAAPPGVVARLKPAAAKLTGAADPALVPLPVHGLAVDVARAGVKRPGGPATRRAVHTVGATGAAATLQFDGLDAAVGEALFTAPVGLPVAMTGSFAGAAEDGTPGTRPVELRGEVGVGGLPKAVRDRAVTNLPDWVGASHLVPPAVGPDLGVDRVRIDVWLGDAGGAVKALHKGLTWTPVAGWADDRGPVRTLAFPLAALPDGLRVVPRGDLRFHAHVQVTSRGQVSERVFAQPVAHGTSFLLGADLPVRVAEFRGAFVPWEHATPGGTVVRADVEVRSGGRRLRAAMWPARHDRDYSLPEPVRLAFLVPDPDDGGVAETAVTFARADGGRVTWVDPGRVAARLPFAVDLLVPRR